MGSLATAIALRKQLTVCEHRRQIVGWMGSNNRDRRQALRLNDEQIKAHLAEVSGWQRADKQIQRDFKFADFKTAMVFVNSVAEAAEAADHHPDILIHGWNNVRLMVTTHSQGGLTSKDFTLAARINELG